MVDKTIFLSFFLKNIMNITIILKIVKMLLKISKYYSVEAKYY